MINLRVNVYPPGRLTQLKRLRFIAEDLTDTEKRSPLGFAPVAEH